VFCSLYDIVLMQLKGCHLYTPFPFSPVCIIIVCCCCCCCSDVWSGRWWRGRYSAALCYCLDRCAASLRSQSRRILRHTRTSRYRFARLRAVPGNIRNL